MKNENVVSRLRNGNVIYGFANEGRKHVVYRATLFIVPVKEGRKVVYRGKWAIESKSHTADKCNEIYYDLVTNWGFRPYYTAEEKAVRQEQFAHKLLVNTLNNLCTIATKANVHTCADLLATNTTEVKLFTYAITGKWADGKPFETTIDAASAEEARKKIMNGLSNGMVCRAHKIEK